MIRGISRQFARRPLKIKSISAPHRKNGAIYDSDNTCLENYTSANDEFITPFIYHVMIEEFYRYCTLHMESMPLIVDIIFHINPLL